MHIHKKVDIAVLDSFVTKFANRYIAQRSETQFDYASMSIGTLFGETGYNTDKLQEIIKQNATPYDKMREMRLEPLVLNDIYRSDLGELLMTYYFEEKLAEGERYIIPLKNISFRERAELPGRGLDAIGYKRIGEDKIEILLGEAKVSAEKKSPPAVVDSTKDSIYHTQKGHHENLNVVIRRLSDYVRRLNATDASMLGYAIINIHNNTINKYSITYGCTLIRDYSCVNEANDFGKMKTQVAEFEPNKIHFSILSFENKTIKETVDLFYKKVQELIEG